MTSVEFVTGGAESSRAGQGVRKLQGEADMKKRFGRRLGLLALATAVSYGPAYAQATGAAGSAGRADAFVLRPGDIIRIGVWPDAALNGEFAVEETGLVYLPFLGAVQVVGMPLDRLRKQLRDGYAEIMKEPVVTITPLFNVGVSGGVGRPGNYQITPTETIMDVILMAGGIRPACQRRSGRDRAPRSGAQV